MATSRKSSQADQTEDAERLLTAVRNNAAVVGDVERERELVESALAVVRVVTGRQQDAAGERQQASKELKAALFDLGESVRHLRVLLKAHIGLREELLVKFGIGPMRLQRRRTGPPSTTPAEPPTEPGVPTPGPTPA
jgi:hypothetical protein